jgi:hypothetical protein
VLSFKQRNAADFILGRLISNGGLVEGAHSGVPDQYCVDRRVYSYGELN